MCKIVLHSLHNNCLRDVQYLGLEGEQRGRNIKAVCLWATGKGPDFQSGKEGFQVDDFV